MRQAAKSHVQFSVLNNTVALPKYTSSGDTPSGAKHIFMQQAKVSAMCPLLLRSTCTTCVTHDGGNVPSCPPLNYPLPMHSGSLRQTARQHSYTAPKTKHQERRASPCMQHSCHNQRRQHADAPLLEFTVLGASSAWIIMQGGSCMKRNGHVEGEQLAAVGAGHLDAEVCVAPPRRRDGCLQQGIAIHQ